MTLVVRDEEDVIETNIRYHLARGVDFVYALDHNSVDGTPDVLRRFEQDGVLRLLQEHGDVHDQSRRVTDLARMAYTELKADWVINNDADEFWWPIAGSLKSVLAAVPAHYGKLIAPRHDFLPRPDDSAPFCESMIWRGVSSRRPTGDTLEPKVVHRGAADVVVAPGNHDATGATLHAAPRLPLIEVLHFPARSYEQFARKVRNTGLGYELLEDRKGETGIDQLKLLELLRVGELERYFELWAVSDAELRRGSETGLYVRDERLRNFLARPRHDANPGGDVKQTAQVISRALDIAIELEKTQESLEAEMAAHQQLEAELNASRSELASERAAHAETREALDYFAQTLETIRNSKLFRWTSGLRRIYYRLR